MRAVTVWAPNATRVRLVVGGPGTLTGGGATTTYEMEPGAGGWFRAEAVEAALGMDYGFLLDDDPKLRFDPRGRRLPEGVAGPSRFWEDTAPWRDGDWQGRALEGAVFYECHVGTFTPAGTLDAAAERLDHLVDLGVTHVELLPLNGFPGRWNWGYDGVAWYAVDEAYGGPDALHRFVEACHDRGLAVCLDVVYNHLGAEGNVLPDFGPYLKEGRNTWGDLVNLDGEGSAEVRAYIIDNALGWLADFHVDALRLDAVHALVDTSPVHLLAELSARVAQLEERLGRPRLLIAEADMNDPVTVTPRDEGGWGLDAQWDDDVHHALHALLTGERQAYYVDFGSLAALGKVLTRAFFHDGTYSTFRGRVHGRPVDPRAPAQRFLAYLQNHDQVGNRAAGERLGALTSRAHQEIGAVLLLTAPFTPMLFMGEEWGASTPFRFFTDHQDPELARSVGEGRIEEFAEHGWDASQMLDPQDPEAFYGSKLDWDELEDPGHAELLARYRELLALRAAEPDLAGGALGATHVLLDEEAGHLAVRRGRFLVLANLGEALWKLTPPDLEELGFSGADHWRVVHRTRGGPEPDADLAVPGRSAVVAESLR